jgi:DNA-binding protein HU-beta
LDAGVERPEMPGFQQLPAKTGVSVDARWRIRRCWFEQERQSMQKAVAKKVETVTLKDLAAELVDTHSLPKAQVNTMLTEMVASLGKHLKKGSRIRISGLGILQVRKRAARMGRNPATGEAIKIKASKKIAFRASKDLKEAVM